jgi:hypothetical protein
VRFREHESRLPMVVRLKEGVMKFGRLTVGLLVMLMPLMISSTPSGGTQDNAEITAAREVIDWFFTGIKNEDIGLIGKAVCQEKDILFSMPVGNQEVTSWRQMEKNYLDFFENASDYDYTIHKWIIKVCDCGDCAWFLIVYSEKYKYSGWDTSWKNSRWSGLMEKIGGDWKIVYSHFSLAGSGN